jgi:hypothetical protein
MSGERLICLVVFPSRIARDPTGLATVSLEQVLERSVIPAAQACGMVVTRLDPALYHDIAEWRVLDQVLLSDIAVFDLTYPSCEVAYLLGTRVALRPSATLLLRQTNALTSLNATFAAAITYQADAHDGFNAASASTLRDELVRALVAVRSGGALESPDQNALYDLLTEYRAKDISRLKTDEFRRRVNYSEDLKQRLADARQRGGEPATDALRELETQLVPLDSVESAVLIDLFLSYRTVSAWQEMIRLFEVLPFTLQRSTMLREQLAMAMNRLGQRTVALRILEDIEVAHGPGSETCALIGRVYKDLWWENLNAGVLGAASKHLSAAISAYQRGFESDWRDAYPGVNAVTLLDIHGSEDSLRLRNTLLPVVRFAAQQRLKHKQPDYWDYATLMELAVIEGNADWASAHLRDALRLVTESWQRETTANNLRFLQRFRRQRGEEARWMDLLITELNKPAYGGCRSTCV